MAPKHNVFGLWTLTALVMANMIGAGVFTTSGFALGDLGSPLRVIAAWIVGAFLALCGAMSYGALARLHPESGGEYLYLSRVIHPLAGFIAGWISLLAGFTATIAYAALTFVAYALPSVSSPGLTNLLACALIAFAVLLHAFQVSPGARLQNLTVAVKVVLILGFCSLAVFGSDTSSWAGLRETTHGTYPAKPFSISVFALSLMWISFSYSGFNAAVYLGSEVPSARERIPHALLLGTALTSLLYVAINTVFVLAPSYTLAAHQRDIAAIAAIAIGGESLALVVRLTVSLALLTSVLALVMLGPRVYAKMADDGLFPRSLRFKGATPAMAIVTQGVLAIAVVWIAGLQQLLSYLGFTLGLSSAATVLSLFVAVGRRPSLARALPGYPWAPAVYVIATVSFALLAATINWLEMLAALLTVASGGLLFVCIRGSGGIDEASD